MTVVVLLALLFGACLAADWTVIFENNMGGCGHQGKCGDEDDHDMEDPRREPREPLIPGPIGSEDSQGIPYLYGPNHEKQVGRSLATEAVFLWGAYYKEMRADLETPVAMRAQFFYWVTQWSALAATKRTTATGDGMYSRIPRADGSYGVPTYKLSTTQLNRLYADDDELEVFRAKAALTALYRLMKVSLSRHFAGDERLMRMEEFFDQLAKPGLERTSEHMLNRGWATPDALIVDVKSTDMGSPDHRTPQYVGNGVGDELDRFYCSDGWNACGMDRGTGQLMKEYYKDVTGYTPSHIANRGGEAENWAPLTECKVGWCWKQDHVVPHIGFTAQTYFLNQNERQAVYNTFRRPTNFDYPTQIRDVLAQTASIANDPIEKTLISYHDNKFNFADALAVAYDEATMTYEDLVYSAMAYLSVEYEGVIINWGSKVSNNHVRPTTVAQEVLGAESTLNYYLGAEGLKSYPSEQWNAYIRVMPHAEFPSGSACLCAAAAEMSARLIGKNLDDPHTWSITHDVGSNTVERRLPEQPFVRTYTTFRQIADECTQSRYKGGMHFQSSLQPGWDMCSNGFAANRFTDKAEAYNKYTWTGNAAFLAPFGGVSAFGFAGDRSYVSPTASVRFTAQ